MANSEDKKEIRILTPVGMIGYGFSHELFWKAVSQGVDAIIADCGSTDSGPQKLARGSMTVSREAYVEDLDAIVAACSAYKIPVLLGSAGGDGSDDHVQVFLDIVKELIQEKGYRSLNVVTINSEIDKDLVRTKLAHGQISPCSTAVPELTVKDVSEATRIVGQMGLEPYVKAMSDYPDFDIIIGGRSYDPAMYAAYCVHRGIDDLGIAYHMGKIMECGALCSLPKSKEALTVVRSDSFDITPLTPSSKCTPLSVAAHTLYEKTRPDVLVGPGGALHLAAATYKQLPDGRSVRVSGGKFVPVAEGQYTVKLEGARVCGFRSAFIGAFRDPILIGQIENFMARVKAYVRSRIDFDYDLKLNLYGIDGVMGAREPEKWTIPKEVFLSGEVRASSQAQAVQVASVARLACVHGPYPHQLANAGNFAMPFSPYDMPLGEISEFNIYHLLLGADPTGLFPISYHQLAGKGTFEHAYLEDATQVSGPAPSPASESPTVVTNGDTPQSLLRPGLPAGQCYLGDIASVIRSKNAGPFELTMDVMFDDEDTYNRVKATGVLSQDTIKKLYSVTDDDILVCMFWDQARAFKTTIKRPTASGSFGETDVHGSQQHVPLLYLVLSLSRA